MTPSHLPASPAGNSLRTGASLLVGLALVALGGCSSKPLAPPPPRAVRVVPVIEAPPTSSRQYSGSLLPRAKVELSFRVPGRVDTVAMVGTGGQRRLVQEGDHVKRGDVLATLDPRDLRHQATAAAASVTAARSELVGAEKALEYASIELERSRKLFAAKAITAAENDRTVAQYEAARARVDAARGQRDARSEQASAARRVIEDARIVSPIDGVVARRGVDIGETATPGRPMFTLIDDRTVRVAFAVPDTRVGQLRLGAELPVRVEALGGRSFRGVVTKIEPTADPGLRTFAAEVTVDNPQRELRIGMVAAVTLDGDATSKALHVPLASVLRSPGSDELFVWVVAAKDGTVSRRVIEVADLVGDDVVVERGVAAGERVVTDGAALLHDGAHVDVQP